MPIQPSSFFICLPLYRSFLRRFQTTCTEVLIQSTNLVFVGAVLHRTDLKYCLCLHFFFSARPILLKCPWRLLWNKDLTVLMTFLRRYEPKYPSRIELGDWGHWSWARAKASGKCFHFKLFTECFEPCGLSKIFTAVVLFERKELLSFSTLITIITLKGEFKRYKSGRCLERNWLFIHFIFYPVALSIETLEIATQTSNH